MGLTAVCNEGRIIISDGGTVVKGWFLDDWKEMEEEALGGGDYTEISVQRHFPFGSDRKTSVYNDSEDGRSSEGDRSNLLMKDQHNEHARREVIVTDTKQGLSKRQESDEPQGLLEDETRNCNSDEDDSLGNRSYYYENRSYKDLKKFGYSIGWRGYWKRTIAQLGNELRAVQYKWSETTECQVLVAEMKKLKTIVSPDIENVVAMGIGSLHDTCHEGSKEATKIQIAALMTIREILGEDGKPLPCVIQDPSCSGLEMDFLRTLGLEPVLDPDAFGRINAKSLVFHVNTYLFIAWWICEGTWPTAMVCNDWGNTSEILQESHPRYCAPRVHDMFEEYERAPFVDVGEREANDWEGVYMYWRKQKSLDRSSAD